MKLYKFQYTTKNFKNKNVYKGRVKTRLFNKEHVLASKEL